MSKPTGQPAFPKLISLSTNGRNGFEAETSEGMTLRDYFAAKAMAAQITNNEWLTFMGKKYNNPSEKIAERSYEWADKMLAEREKGQQ